jgi:hypothetical protein
MSERPDIDAAPAARAAIERLVHLRSTSVMTVAHEFAVSTCYT